MLGAVTMIPPLMLTAGEQPGSLVGHVVASIFAIGITVTNWMVAVFASLVDLGWKLAAVVGAAALAAATFFGEAHRVVFPNAVKMFKTAGGEAAYMWAPETGGPWAIIRAFFFHSMVAPEITFKVNWRHENWPMMSMQFSGLFSGVHGWSCVATLSWTLLLMAGFAALATLKDQIRLRTTLLLSILYQFLLHLLYGRETFLYGIHFMPLLILCVALATRTRWRPVVLALSAVLCVSASINNYRQFEWCHAYVMRGDRLQEKQAPQHKRLGIPLDKSDPTWNYRFWRDVLHWGPPLQKGWDADMFK
ncbi:MAG: hypothetical protein JO102_05880 [Elusimicrobia bacterium]|nr:hypothetical protein [Elusimicrobiota bacterium]